MKTSFNPWDIVLCPMKFSDWILWKIRPVVILTENRGDFLVCSISTQILQWWPFDLYIKSDTENNLRSGKSVIMVFKMATISPELIHKKLWKLSKLDRIHLKENMQKFVNSW